MEFEIDLDKGKEIVVNVLDYLNKQATEKPVQFCCSVLLVAAGITTFSTVRCNRRCAKATERYYAKLGKSIMMKGK